MGSVSVVIPTRKRHTLVVRAINSVLAQTHEDLEIIVVIDGPDPATTGALTAIGDKRLRWVELPETVGGAEARNVGIGLASSFWVALLDDDDEWLPSKLAEQLWEAKSRGARCLIASRFIDSRPNAKIIQPGLRPRSKQPISEYLFCETSILGFRNGFVQTSTWLAPREVFLAVPFTKGLPRNQETDWLIRAFPKLNLELHIVWKALVIFHNEKIWDELQANLTGVTHYGGLLMAGASLLNRCFSLLLPCAFRAQSSRTSTSKYSGGYSALLSDTAK